MRTIELTQGKEALVDDEDYEYLSRYNWYYDKGYAVRNVCLENSRRTIIPMHRLINNTPEEMITDHINGNMLDNRRCNLRSCTNIQNSENRGANKNNTSGKRGVHWDRNRGKWLAYINYHRKFIHLGRFTDIDNAYKARIDGEKRYFGEFAFKEE